MIDQPTSKSIWKTEPVRVIGYVVAGLAFVSGIVTQITTSWDSSTGWYGLALSAVVAISTELQRSRVSPVE